MQKSKRKRASGKMALVVIIAIIAVIGAITAFVMIANTVTCVINLKYAQSFDSVQPEPSISPKKTEDGYEIVIDKELKVLHLTDVHIGGGFMSYSRDKKALTAVASLVKQANPDLVIITGDLTFAVIKSGSFNNARPARELAALMESLGVYWTLVPGNHDVETYDILDYPEWSSVYEDKEYTKCLYERGSTQIFGYGNQVIDVKNAKGDIVQSLIMLDSNSYPEEHKVKNELSGIYDNIHEDQIDWYKNMVEKRSSEKQKVSSLMFFHIPLEEFNTAWKEYKENGYKDTENVKYFFGRCDEENETVCSPAEEDEVFETVQELGSTKGIFCGHDHLNNFSVEYKGIRLTYGMSIDYLAYSGIDKLTQQRGAEVITLYPDSEYEVEQLSYKGDRE